MFRFFTCRFKNSIAWFRSTTTHLYSKSSPYTIPASLKSRQAVLSSRFFTCRFKNSIFEHFTTNARYEHSIQKSIPKGLVICSPYVTNTMLDTTKPLLHTMGSH